MSGEKSWVFPTLISEIEKKILSILADKIAAEDIFIYESLIDFFPEAA